jgi:hypothetical protein
MLMYELATGFHRVPDDLPTGSGHADHFVQHGVISLDQLICGQWIRKCQAEQHG